MLGCAFVEPLATITAASGAVVRCAQYARTLIEWGALRRGGRGVRGVPGRVAPRAASQVVGLFSAVLYAGVAAYIRRADGRQTCAEGRSPFRLWRRQRRGGGFGRPLSLLWMGLVLA